MAAMPPKLPRVSDDLRFAAITRRGKIEKTLEGVFAAKAAGLAVKINAVALRDVNEDEFDAMVAWCGEHGFDLCLIETMPLGDIEGDRTDQYLPLSLVRSRLKRHWTLVDTDYRTGGPARYVTVAETFAVALRLIGEAARRAHRKCVRVVEQHDRRAIGAVQIGDLVDGAREQRVGVAQTQLT